MQDSGAIIKVSEIISSQNENLVVVVSAMGGMTDSLISLTKCLKLGDYECAYEQAEQIRSKHVKTVYELDLGKHGFDYIQEIFTKLFDIVKASRIIREVSDRMEAKIISFGEMLSSGLLYHLLLKQGRQAFYVDSRKLIQTASDYPEAEVEIEKTYKTIYSVINPQFTEVSIAIAPGFVGSGHDGETTLLGRGGSDYSAALYAAALKASSLEIWTDVNGMFTTDPRSFSDARLIEKLSYSEAAELAYFGAKVLHPKTILPAIERDIPVIIKNTFNPDEKGTTITAESFLPGRIKAIAYRKGITVINVASNRMLGAHGFLAMVFDIFREYKTPVDIVTTSEVSISLTIDNDSRLMDIKQKLQEFSTVKSESGYAIIAAVGEGIRDMSGIAARFFGVLKGVNVNMVSVGASEINISITVKEDRLEEAVSLLHKEFIG